MGVDFTFQLLNVSVLFRSRKLKVLMTPKSGCVLYNTPHRDSRKPALFPLENKPTNQPLISRGVCFVLFELLSDMRNNRNQSFSPETERTKLLFFLCPIVAGFLEIK